DINPRDLNRRDEDETDLNLRKQLAQRLEKAALHLNPELIDDPKTLARLQHVLGSTLHDLGRRDLAVTLLRDAYAVRKNLLGPDDSDTLESLQDLATAYHAAGQADFALP